MGSRAERAALNEALFRDINEQINEVNRVQRGHRFDALCECSDPGCAATISIRPDEYRAVRSRGDRFALLAGHEHTDIEEVVEQTDRFVVVKKLGKGAEIARELDPRS